MVRYESDMTWYRCNRLTRVMAATCDDVSHNTTSNQAHRMPTWRRSDPYYTSLYIKLSSPFVNITPSHVYITTYHNISQTYVTSFPITSRFITQYHSTTCAWPPYGITYHTYTHNTSHPYHSISLSYRITHIAASHIHINHIAHSIDHNVSHHITSRPYHASVSCPGEPGLSSQVLSPQSNPVASPGGG